LKRDPSLEGYWIKIREWLKERRGKNWRERKGREKEEKSPRETHNWGVK